MGEELFCLGYLVGSRRNYSKQSSCVDWEWFHSFGQTFRERYFGA
jgi:hypothetical protein